MAQTETIPLGTDRELYDASCKVIVHLCDHVAKVRGVIPNEVWSDEILPVILERQKMVMNALGDWLDAWDAVDEEEDAWMDPVFEAFRQRFTRELDED